MQPPGGETFLYLFLFGPQAKGSPINGAINNIGKFDKTSEPKGIDAKLSPEKDHKESAKSE
jgi:hypothetical protein